MKLYKIALFAGTLLMAACGQKSETQSTEVKEEHTSDSSLVSLTEMQMKTASVELDTIEMKNLTTSIRVNGTLAVPNQNKAVITSLANGVLRTLQVQPGAYVSKGQQIGTIANTELSSIQQQLVSINSQIVFAEQEQKRQRELVAGNAAPMKNLQKAEAELNGLKAQQTALKRQLEVLGVSSKGGISGVLSITAPISGTISEISAQIGSQINANSPIAQIINNSELHLDLFIYEKDLPKVVTGQTIHFTLTNNPGKEYDATIYSIGTAFVNETKAIPVHAKVINNKTGLIEGMTVTARISLGENVYPAVPDEAIVNEGGKDYIFILNSINSSKPPTNGTEDKEGTAYNFKKVQIIKGTSDVGYTEIKLINEIPKGSKIVTKGSFFIMAKMTNSGEEE